MMGMTGFTVALVMLLVVMVSPCAYGKEFADDQEMKVQTLLKRLNKPAVKTIKSDDGDIIDCVPIASQPALDHPLLRNHTIQMRPRFVPEGESKYTEKKAKSIIQVWQKNGECPENTVPVRRTKREDILRANFGERFGKKTHQSFPNLASSNVLHEYAIMESDAGTFFGTKFTINIWKPYVERANEFSLAQTWLVSGFGNDVNTIEAGWQVYRGLYSDDNPRLFVFWTSTGYKGQLCYNLDCTDGFVQMSNSITPGGSLLDASQLDGDQKELEMHIWKDGVNWWLKIDNELVGYWPSKLFTNLNNGATKVQWGGEIVNQETFGRHTTTDMGSGNFAEEGEKKASYFRNIMVVDKANALQEPQKIYKITTHETCYTFKLGDKGTSWGINFFFGGPGQNPNCP